MPLLDIRNGVEILNDMAMSLMTGYENKGAAEPCTLQSVDITSPGARARTKLQRAVVDALAITD